MLFKLELSISHHPIRTVDYSQVKVGPCLCCRIIMTPRILLRSWYCSPCGRADSLDQISPKPLSTFQSLFHPERFPGYA